MQHLVQRNSRCSLWDVSYVGKMHQAYCHIKQFKWQPVRYEQFSSVWINYKEHVQHDMKQKKNHNRKQQQVVVSVELVISHTQAAGLVFISSENLIKISVHIVELLEY